MSTELKWNSSPASINGWPQWPGRQWYWHRSRFKALSRAATCRKYHMRTTRTRFLTRWVNLQPPTTDAIACHLTLWTRWCF